MLIRRTLLYLPAQLMSPLIQFAIILTWAHLLPANEVGVLTLVVAIQEISFGLFYMWWTQHALRHIVSIRNTTSTASYLRTETATSLILIAAQVLLLTPIVFFYFGKEIDAVLLPSIVFMIITRSINNFLSERFRAESKIFVYTVIQICVPAASLFMGVVLCFLWKPTALAMILAFTGAQGAGIAIALCLGDFARLIGAPSRAILAQALRFGLPVMLASLLAIVANNSPRFIVDRFLGIETAGYFAIAYGFGLRVSSFASMMVTAGSYPLVVSKMEREGLNAAYQQLRQNIVLLLFVLVPAGVGLISINRSLIAVVFPADFAGIALAVLPLSALAGIIRDLRNHTTNQVFLIRSRTVYATGLAIVDVSLSLAFSILGLKIWGASGAVLGPLLATSVTLILSLVFARLKFSFGFPWIDLLRICAAAIFMAGCVTLFPITSSALYLAAQISVGVFAYSLGILLLFRKQLKLKERLSRWRSSLITPR